MQNNLVDISDFVLFGSLYNDNFSRQTIQFINPEYFETSESRILFEAIRDFRIEFSAAPTPSALMISISSGRISACDLVAVETKLENIRIFWESDEQVEERWLVKETEKWCKERAFYLTVLECADAVDSKKNLSELGLVERMADALAVSFDKSIGMEFLEDAVRRYEFYHSDVVKIPSPIKLINVITKGGIVKKSLTCLMSNTTGGFKSGTMCDWAAFLMREGYNVLYITCEMSEEKIAHRVDANCMNMELDYVEEMPRKMYLEKSEAIKRASSGRLMIREYPNSTAHSGHFRFLIKELKVKKNFVPDVVFIDYINICASSRLKAGESSSYFYIKAIAEELRGLAAEMDFACVTATQSNRSAINSSDMSMGDVAESYGLPQTCDLLLGIITTEDLDELKQIRFKQLKNRYGDTSYFKAFSVGVDKAKMQLFDLDESATIINNTGVDGSSLLKQKPAATYKDWNFD